MSCPRVIGYVAVILYYALVEVCHTYMVGLGGFSDRIKKGR